MKLRSLKRSTDGRSKILKRSRRVNGTTVPVDLAYTYSILGEDRVEVTLKRHKGNDTHTTVRALMKRVARGDQASRPVLKAVMRVLLNRLYDQEDDPNAANHDLLLALGEHWSELVDGACASLVRVA